MIKLVLCDTKQIDVLMYAKVLAIFSSAKIFNLMKSAPKDWDKYPICVFVLKIKSGHVDRVENLLDNWESLRYKKVVLLLLGSAPEEHPVYQQIFENDIPPTLRDKINFYPISFLPETISDGSFMNEAAILLKYLTTNLRKKIKNHISNVITCLEFLQGQ